MSSPRRFQFQRWGLGIVASFLIFMTVPALGWAMFNSQSTNTSSVTASSDWTPPSVAVGNPGSAVRATATITATASDAETGVRDVVLAWAPSGAATWTTICTDAVSPYACGFNTAGVADGYVDLRAVATDNAGYSAYAVFAGVLVDNTAPAGALGTIPSPMNGTATINATATDAASGVASVAVQRATSGTTTWTTICTDTASPYSCAFDSTTVADGTYDFRAVVTDLAGNTANSAVTGPVLVDNAPFRGLDVQATSGGQAGKLSAGDSITLTYSRAVKASSLLAGWDGTSRAVVVRLRDGQTVGLTASDDILDVFTSSAYTTPLNLGAVDLKENFVDNNKTVPFNATITASGATVTVTIGAPISGSTNLRTATGSASMVWGPSALALDANSLPCSTAVVTETGTKDLDF